ncbi:MAG: YggS family pyridoxal phosphate enzyme [Acidimicrobiales bacterium]
MTLAGPTDGVAQRLARLRDLIEAGGRDPASVRIVGVTKGHPAEVCRVALDAGLTELGESYAQELVGKAGEPDLAGVRWHFVGGLQARRVRTVAGAVHLWQSIDRPKLVAEVARWAPGARILVQVALSDEPGRAGCAFSDVSALVAEAVGAGLQVEGLMGVGPGSGGPEGARPAFRRLARTAAELGLGTVSMGMSADVSVALAEGATVVRVGTALFGPRTARAAVRAWAP